MQVRAVLPRLARSSLLGLSVALTVIAALITSNAPASAGVVGKSSSSTGFYDRLAAVQWAVENYDHNPLIQNGGDCTWYASQVLWAGGMPQSRVWAKYSPDGVLGNDLQAAAKAAYAGYSPANPVNPTSTATTADDFVKYLVAQGLATKNPITWSDNTAAGAELGDVIAYDWDEGSDGSIDHVAVVTGYTAGTSFPTVSQHSANRLNRYWSFDPASNGWVEDAPNNQPKHGNGRARAWLIHIVY